MNYRFIICSLALALGACQNTDSTSRPQQAQSETPNTMREAQAIINKENQRFFAWSDSQAKNLIREAPLLATSLGLSEEYVGIKFNDKLGDYSLSAIAKDKQRHQQMLEELKNIDRSALSGVAATSYDVLFNALTMTQQFKPHVNGAFNSLSIFAPFTITQLSGAHINLPRSLQSEHPIKNEADARAYLLRLKAFKKAFTDQAEVLLADFDAGITPPKFAISGAINVVGKMTEAKPSAHPLVLNLKNKLSELPNIDKTKQAELLSEASEIVSTHVYPGYQVLKATLETLLPRASEHAGIWDVANGATRYQLALENFGAAGKTAEQIHQIGLEEVARIQQQMDQVLRSQGYADGPVIQRYIKLSEQPEFIYPNTQAGREALISDLNQQMRQVDALLPKILKTLPKASVEVKRIAEHEQDTAPGGYYTSPSMDGSRPGIYWINLKDTADWPKFTLPTLTYHEASPGHHLQVSIAQEIENMPMLRNMLWFSAHGEGWALYAESLAKELDLYKDDPFGDLGRLQSELFRATRLVVDTGLHHKRWSREQAIDYMRQTTGESLAAVTREIERYSVWPGQACAYKLGHLKILALREKAKTALQGNFNLSEFNDQLVIHGAVPLLVLEKNIDAWIIQKQTKA